MKYGVREICDVVFKAKQRTVIGTQTFEKGQPVLYIDSAKTSTLEGAATTVYAQGGKGNTRLVTWEGEKTLTFTVEDALISPISFSMLSGAGLVKKGNGQLVHVHKTVSQTVSADGKIDLTDGLLYDEEAGIEEAIDQTAPIFVLETEDDGSITGATIDIAGYEKNSHNLENIITVATKDANKNVLVDFYITKASAKVAELQIDAENFAGTYYVEASTLFRSTDGIDYPAEITLPTVKIQSNFTFSMASTGDPSTFTFTMDAMPGYTYFNGNKKVLCAIQIVEESEAGSADNSLVMPHLGTNEQSI